MSKLHVLSFDGHECDVVIHKSMPPGDNSVGNSWQDCYVSDNTTWDGTQWVGPTSSLKVGTTPGNITQLELNDIEGGAILEIKGRIRIESGNLSNTSINVLVDKIIDEVLGELQTKYKHYGKVIA